MSGNSRKSGQGRTGDKQGPSNTIHPNFNSPENQPISDQAGQVGGVKNLRAVPIPDATLMPPALSQQSPGAVDPDRAMFVEAVEASGAEDATQTSPTMSRLTGTDATSPAGRSAEDSCAEPVATDANATIVVRPEDLPPDPETREFDPHATIKAPAGLLPGQINAADTAAVTPSMLGAGAGTVPGSGNGDGQESQRIRRHRFDLQPELKSGGSVPRLSPAVATLVDNDVHEYETLKVIGEGGMGVVVRARQKSLYRDLAVKTLRPDGNNPVNQEMFVTEAVITAALVHPNIIPVHDLGLDAQGRLFYSMKEITGRPWKDLIERSDARKRKAELEGNVDILLKVCDAIAYAHQQGVVHRDLKPENVSVGKYGEVIVLDWGLAVPLAQFRSTGAAGPSRPQPLRVAGEGCGSLPWMAPEQLRSLNDICPQTDIYLLGAILFEIIEGFQPHWLREFDGLTGVALRTAISVAVIENRIEAEVENPGELMEIARRAMATSPEDRYQSVADFKLAIQQYRLTGRAEELLLRVEGSADRDHYELYQQSVALFARAVQDWPDNERARKGERVARLAFAELALKRGDYDLGIEICEQNSSTANSAIVSSLKRQRFQRKFIRATWLVLGAAAAVLLLVAVKQNFSLEKTNVTLKEQKEELVKKNGEIADAKKSAKVEQKKADDAKIVADKAIESAEIAKQQAADEQKKADEAKKSADEAKKSADEAIRIAGIEADAAKKRAADAQKEAADLQKEKVVAQKEAADATAAAQLAKESVQKQVYENLILEIDTAESLEDWQRVIEVAEKALDSLKSNLTVRPQQLKAIETRLKNAKERSAKPDANGRFNLPEPDPTAKVSGKETLIPGGGGVLRLEGDSGTAELHGVRVFLARADTTLPADSGVLAELPRTLTNTEVSRAKVRATATASRVWLWAGKRLFVWQKTESGGYRLAGDRQLPAEIKDVDADNAGRLFVVCSDKVCSMAIYDVADGKLNSMLPADAVLFADTEADYTCTAFGVTADGAWILHYTKTGVDRYLRAFPVDWSDPSRPLLPADAGSVPMKKLSELQATEGAPKDIATVADLQISEDGSTLLLTVVLRQNDRWFARLPALSQQRSSVFPFGMQIGWFRSGDSKPPEYVRMSANGHLIVASHARARKNIEVWRAAEDGSVSAFSLPAGVVKVRGNRHRAGGSLIAGLTEQPTDILPLDEQSGRFLSISNGVLTRWNLSTYGEWIRELVTLLREFTIQPRATLEGNRNVIAGYSPVVLRWPADEVVAATVPLDSAELSLDGERLILGGLDRAAHVISSEELQPVLNLSERPDPLRVSGGRGLFLEGHTSNITAARFLSAESGLLLTSENLGVISVWDARVDSDGLGREVSRLVTGYGSGVFSVSRDGSLIVADGAELRGDNLIYQALIWRSEELRKGVAPLPVLRLEVRDAADEALYAQKQIKPVFQITATAVSPNNGLVAVGGRQGELTIWEVESGKPVALQRAHSGDQISGLWFLNDLEFVSSGYDGRLLRWQLNSDNQLSFRELYRGQQLISLSASPDGRWYVISDIVAKPGAVSVPVAGSARRQVPTVQKIVALSAGGDRPQLLFERDLPVERPDLALQTAASWNDDSTQLLLTLPDRLVFYSSVDWKPLRQLAISIDAGVPRGPGRAVFAPSENDGQQIASISERRAILWDLASGNQICEFRSHHSERVTASFSADRRFVLTASEALRVFDADETSPTKGRTLYRMLPEQSHQSPLHDARFVPLQGDYRFLTVERQGSVKLWNCNSLGIPDAQPLWRSEDEVAEPSTADANQVRWSGNGQWFAAVRSGRVSCWNLSGAAPVSVELPIPDGLNAQWNTLVFSDDNRVLAVGGKGREAAGGEEQGLVLLWRLTAEQPAVLVGKLTGEVYIAAGDINEENSSGQILRGGVTALAFSNAEVATSGGNLYVGDSTGGVTRWVLGEFPEVPTEPEPVAYEKQLKRETDGHLGRIMGLFRVDGDGDDNLISVDNAGRVIRWP